MRNRALVTGSLCSITAHAMTLIAPLRLERKHKSQIAQICVLQCRAERGTLQRR
jgi:hypothetical protein